MRPATALITLATGLAVAGCRSEGDGASVAQLRAEQRQASSAAVTAGTAVAHPEVTLRRLSTSNDYDGFHASDLSPDGRYVSLIDWRTDNVAVRDLRTGTLHLLTEGHYEGGEPWEGAGVPIFSRDGRRMAYGWQYGGDLQIRVMDFEPDEAGVPRAAEPRVIFYNPEFYPYYPFDWSPDGGHILAKVYLLAGNTNQLALISVEDGTYRALKSFDWREPELAEFSPDGRYVAYDLPPEQDSPNRDVFVVSLDGTHEARVVARTVTPAEWQGRRMRGDRVTVSPDGSKLAIEARSAAGSDDRWIGTIPVGGGPFSPVVPVEGLLRGLEWTPDGRALVFSTLPDGTWPEEPWETWIVSAEGGQPRPLELMEHANPGGMKLHPDGRRIAFLAGESREEVWVMEGPGRSVTTNEPGVSR